MDAAGELNAKPTPLSSSIMDAGADSTLQREEGLDERETD